MWGLIVNKNTNREYKPCHVISITILSTIIKRSQDKTNNMYHVMKYLSVFSCCISSYFYTPTYSLQILINEDFGICLPIIDRNIQSLQQCIIWPRCLLSSNYLTFFAYFLISLLISLIHLSIDISSTFILLLHNCRTRECYPLGPFCL